MDCPTLSLNDGYVVKADTLKDKDENGGLKTVSDRSFVCIDEYRTGDLLVTADTEIFVDKNGDGVWNKGEKTITVGEYLGKYGLKMVEGSVPLKALKLLASWKNPFDVHKMDGTIPLRRQNNRCIAPPSDYEASAQNASSWGGDKEEVARRIEKFTQGRDKKINLWSIRCDTVPCYDFGTCRASLETFLKGYLVTDADIAEPKYAADAKALAAQDISKALNKISKEIDVGNIKARALSGLKEKEPSLPPDDDSLGLWWLSGSPEYHKVADPLINISRNASKSLEAMQGFAMDYGIYSGDILKKMDTVRDELHKFNAKLNSK